MLASSAMRSAWPWPGSAIVRLTGVVPTEDDARAAEFDAWCTFAVNGVENELRVQRTR